MRRLLPIVLFAVVATSCSAGQVPNLPDPTTRAPLTEATTTTSAPTTTEPPVVPGELDGFEVRPISIEDGELTYLLTVAVADTTAKRAQGLMGLADLGDLDGMLFVYEQPTTSTFWMKDTLVPLDIAFFNAEGDWVNNFTMQPCLDEECPTYSAEGQYLYAVEVPDAGFATLTPAATLNPEL
ncbi:MAG: DUF192 domain-containing protein [Acidimicrobiia bacterium]|nr:DUF192 domain-containing protein [Acidimicrobiia bacterium]